MENNSSPHKARNEHGSINAIIEYRHTEKTVAKFVVLVEGPDDVKAYRKFLDQKMTELFFCNGKDNLQRFLLELLTETESVIGIRDADFCNLENIKPENPHLFFTDSHDIEMTMLSFEEIRRTLFSEYGDWGNMDTVWKSIVKKASFVGYIRWFNEKNDCKIMFKGFFNEYSSIDEEQLLLDELNDRSHEKKEAITMEMVDGFMARYNTNDIFNLCNGHDVSTLLATAFKINTNFLSSALRLSFQWEQFRKTGLCQDILAWQDTHGKTILYSFSDEAVPYQGKTISDKLC